MNWSEPSELAQPLPRVVQLTKSYIVIIASITALFSVIGSILLMLIFLLAFRMATLLNEGILTAGVIDDLKTETNRRSNNYFAEYSFDAPTRPQGPALLQHGRSPLTASDYATLHVGSPAWVVYRPTRPDVSELQLTLRTLWSHPWANFFNVAAILVGVFGSTLLIIVVVAAKQYFKERHLVRWGKAVPAEIIRNEQIQMRFGQATRLIYQFRDEAGSLVQGARGYLPARSKYTSSAYVDAILQSPTVLYDPKRPWRNMLYPPTAVTLQRPG